ncbi:MAG: cytochrome c oxidase subunit II [Phycisphaerae bacterium]|nr:cytochrome c oxidase subunit II [Gemmatimonadaceae bacterium]
MVGKFRSRRVMYVALLGALALGLAACGGVYPNTTFSHNSDYNTSIDELWDKLLLLGTIVFVGVEAALVYVIFRFRRRPDSPQPKPVHGSTTLEITWTVIPALVLIVIAIPTVKTIFRTQANAAPDALLVEAIGHQWWWEFRYPQLNISTANELYLPTGRTVSFKLKTVDVLHSFWIPAMGGKRDLVTNRTNYMWFTPNDTLPSSAWNGACAEFCGESHANMKFRNYIVKPDEFEAWVKNQQSGIAVADATPLSAIPTGQGDSAALKGGVVPRGTTPTPIMPTTPAQVAAAAAGEPAPPAVPTRAVAWTFPADKIESQFAYTIPRTPIPDGNDFDDSLLPAGDVARGKTAAALCQACHAFTSNAMPYAVDVLAPNLTHIGSRHTIASGLYPNDARHLARWIKNSGHMKPGSKMTPFGKGQIDGNTGKPSGMGLYTDAQIADIVAYLQALK